MRAVRLATNPLIRPNMDGSMGENINGPSLIKVPDWIERPLGRYYLYFAHHDGRYIRLAFADAVEGPWKMYEAGVLPLAESHFRGHLASPDVHVDDEKRRIRMYFHGSDQPSGAAGVPQFTRVALSSDGLRFAAEEPLLGKPYFRVFEWRGHTYALAMPGVIYRSRDGLRDFAQGPTLFSKNMRHSAVRIKDDTLQVFYTDVGDAPERILLSTIDLTQDWMNWTESAPGLVLSPDEVYEGADCPNEPSVRGLIPHRARQLRDPAIYAEGGRTFLLYAIAGESGIAAAELFED
jgi:hypothetical protein